MCAMAVYGLLSLMLVSIRQGSRHFSLFLKAQLQLCTDVRWEQETLLVHQLQLLIQRGHPQINEPLAVMPCSI